ncbi:hypothetical protein EG68_10091 [Paragonimus skrjabini miyazakii]|uniref:Ig-like domain-containing protein n=1 Tax=Paragonimus skrjabini miyazakii TaxID=59628 RepID=A0A8S9YLU3_9TREM|nr:hypothetical protein EG68_10091 [Paragonimus skrjabini miyazakii]
MYGLMDVQQVRPPVCFYGYQNSTNTLAQGKQFKVSLHQDYGYFELTKSHAELTDSGVYSCAFSECHSCSPLIGLGLRTLLVLPDPSALKLSLYLIPLPESWDLRCPTGFVSRVAPGESIKVNCIHTVPLGAITNVAHTISHGVIGDPTTEVQLDQSDHLVLPGPLGSVNVRSSSTFQVPTFAQLTQLWYVRCRIPYDALLLRDDHSKRSSSGYLSVKQQFRILHKRRPRIVKHWIKVAERTVERSDLDLLDRPLDVGQFLQSGPPKRLNENLLEVMFTVDLGEPRGWTFIRLYYVSDANLHSDKCALTKIASIPESGVKGGRITHTSYCPVQPEHVALLMTVVSLPEDTLTRELAEIQLDQAILVNISRWLGYHRLGDGVTGDRVFCFYYDYHLIRLKVGWNATVNVTEPIIMQGKLGGQRPDMITCFYQISDKYPAQPITDNFQLKLMQAHDMFQLIKPNASIYDTGVYFCNGSRSDNLTVYMGMLPRKLSVLPTTVQVQCNLTLDQAGKLHVNQTGEANSSRSYLHSNQTAYVKCSYDEVLDSLYDIIYLMTYRMMDNATGALFSIGPPKLPVLVTVNRSKTFIQHIYQITTPTAQEYRGPIQVSCLSVFENLTSSLSISSWNGSLTVECHQWFTIQEEANGVLEIRTLSKNYEFHPVPLGSEFFCTGGNGMPRLSYVWTRIKSTLYEQDGTDNNWASLLPGDGGGWGGPKQPFVDMPLEDGLYVDGALLRVPEDAKYRGMTYLYVCTASNVIHNVKHTISKEVHLSILICPTDRLQLDLVVLLETRLMAGCNILQNTYSDIRFYGYFYLTLVRQLILGLPFGSDWASFSFVYRAKESRRMNYKPAGRLKYQNVKFERYWNRIGLAESLYSRTNRPSSADSACLTPWIDLPSLLHEVNTLYEHGFTQNPVFWLTVDYFVELSNLTQILSEVMKLQKYGIRIILSFTHPLNETPFKEFNEKLTALLKPINTMSILPHFEGTTDCHKCQWSMDSDIGRIERSELFDAVCRVAGSHLPKPIQPPRLTFSMPKSAWFHGLHLLVTCTASVVDTDELHLMTELVVCLTDAITVNNLSLVPPSNVQRLHNACHQRLHNRKTQSTSQEPLIEPVSLTVTVVLQPNTSNAMLLCYQRLGEEEPKLFDATSFVHTSVASVPTVISRPALHYTTYNEKSRIKTGRFWCTFYGFFSDLEVLLLFVIRTNDTLVPRKYVEVARTLPQLQPGAHLTKIPLFWLELSEVDQSGEFICLIRPMEPKEHASDSLVSLPETSALVKFSHPLPMPGVTSSTCPAAPVCQVTPNETSSVSGGGLNFRCSAKIVLGHNTIKMFYLTATSSFILCIPTLNEKQWQLQQHVPCLPVEANDQDCTKTLLNDPSIQTFHSHRCHVLTLNVRFAVLSSIEFQIKQLRIHDFHGHLFCRTLDLLTLGTSEEFAIRERLTSSVHTIRFPLRPQITQFYFDRLNYRWICQVVGYPLPSRLASIDLVRAEPMWLGKQMEVYKVHVNRTQPSVRNEHLVPAWIVANTKRILYTLSLVFQPTVPLVGGLTKGIVQLRCTFGEVNQLLRTKIGAKTGSYERLLHEPLLLKAGDVLNVVCTLKSTPDDPILHMNLHRLVKLNWANYDLTVLTITFRSNSHLSSQSVHNTVQPTFSPIGPWVINGELSTRVRVLTVQTEQNRSVDVSLLSSEVFDTAFYYCSGRSMSGSYHQTDLYFNLFHGGSKRITFGYQVSDRPNLWTSARKHVPINEHLLLRCIAWSTNASDRLVRQLNLGPSTVGRSRAKIVYNGSTLSGLVLRVVEHSLIATAQSMWDRFDCQLLDKERRHQVILSSPTVQCRQPVRLRWVPSTRSSYARSTVVTCTADQTCINMTFKWNWLAGPIPQLTMDTALKLDDHISRGRSLFLRKLPRSGTYLFRCSVSCVCANRTLSYSITGELTVRPDSKELLHSNSDEIEDSELDELLRQQELYEADESVEKLTRNFTDPSYDTTDKPQEEDEQMTGITQYTSEHLSGGPSNEEFAPEKISTQKYLVFLPTLMKSTNSQQTEVIIKRDFTRNQLDNAIRRTPENLYDLVVPQTTYNRVSVDQVLDRQDRLVDEPVDRPKKWTHTFYPAIWPYRMPRLHTTSQMKPSFENERLYPPYLDFYTDVLSVAEDSEDLEHVQRIRLGLAQSTKRNASFGRRRWFPRVSDTNLADANPYTTWLETYTNLAPSRGAREQQLERLPGRRADGTLFNHTRDSEPTGVAWNCHLLSGMYLRSEFDRLYCEDTDLVSNKRKQKRKRYTHSEVDRIKNRLHLLDTTSHFGNQAQDYVESLKEDPVNVKSELVNLPWEHRRLTGKHTQTTRSPLDYRTDAIARWPIFDDNVEYTENLMGFHNQLLNRSWLRQIKLNHSFHNLPWVFDSVRNAYRPILPPVSAYFMPTRPRDFEPDERLDLMLAGFDQRGHQRPWWSRMIHEQQGNLPEVKYSALHLLDGISHAVAYDDATKATSGQWQAWGQYVQRMQAVLYGWLLSGSTENGKHNMSEDTVANEVLILPGVAQPPGPVTLVCPIASVTDKHHDYQFVKLTWFRIVGLTATEESIVKLGIQKRDIWFDSARFSRPEVRAYGFPPFRWSRSYTLDIKPLQTGDYGYYGCVNRYESTRSNTYAFNIPTISNHPLCTFAEQSRPRLGFALHTNGSWYEVTSKIGIKLDGHTDLVDRRKMNYNTNVNFDLSNSNMTHCFRSGDELIVLCELNPYRLFCEKADEVANGTRLISTELQAHLYLRTGGLRSHRVSLAAPIRSVPPISGWSGNSSGWGLLSVHAWHLSLSYEHHGAQVMCEAQPRLQVPAFGPPVYWTWLNAQWNANHKQHWTQSSKLVGLCVLVNESTIRIRPEPVYTDIGPHSLGLVQITPGQAISCHVTHQSITWPTLTLHRVETGQLHLVQSHGAKLKSEWLKRDRFATGQWPRFSHPNVIRMLVPSRLTVLGFYLAECTATGTTLSKTFLLEVYASTKPNALELNIERVWMAVTLPGVVLLYLCLRRYLGLQRNRTQHGFLPSHLNRRPNVLSGENLPR